MKFASIFFQLINLKLRYIPKNTSFFTMFICILNIPTQIYTTVCVYRYSGCYIFNIVSKLDLLFQLEF